MRVGFTAGDELKQNVQILKKGRKKTAHRKIAPRRTEQRRGNTACRQDASAEEELQLSQLALLETVRFVSSPVFLSPASRRLFFFVLKDNIFFKMLFFLSPPPYPTAIVNVSLQGFTARDATVRTAATT